MNFIITKTDTLKAKYSVLPIVDTNISFMVEVLEPIKMIPVIKKVYHDMTKIDQDGITKLKALLLKEWNEHLVDSQKKGPDWLYNIKNVDLIECDLLIPKVK